MEHTLSYVTLAGLPLLFELRWPFHKSTSGGDFHVLHGVVTLADGSDLHANIAVHLSAAVAELLPSLDKGHVESIVINALRKWTDRKELEFLKSTKLQPLPLSSRFLAFKTKVWTFENATDEQIEQSLKDKIYWSSFKRNGDAVLVADPVEAQYLGTSTEKLVEAARKLENSGWLKLNGTSATPGTKVALEVGTIEKRAKEAFEAVQQKHAFEAAKVTH